MSKHTPMPWGVDKDNREPYFDCPKMKRIPCCSCNECPLDPAYPEREVLPFDPEKRCTLSRRARVVISSRYPGVLRFNGQKPREKAGKDRWNRLSEEMKARKLSILKERKGETL